MILFVEIRGNWEILDIILQIWILYSPYKRDFVTQINQLLTIYQGAHISYFGVKQSFESCTPVMEQV